MGTHSHKMASAGLKEIVEAASPHNLLCPDFGAGEERVECAQGFRTSPTSWSQQQRLGEGILHSVTSTPSQVEFQIPLRECLQEHITDLSVFKAKKGASSPSGCWVRAPLRIFGGDPLALMEIEASRPETGPAVHSSYPIPAGFCKHHEPLGLLLFWA